MPTIIGVCNIELYIPEAGSLKAKRHVVKSIKDRVRNKFNVAIAEVGHHDLWQRTILGVVTISNEKKQVDTTLSNVVSFIDNTHLALIAQYQIETF